MSARGKEFQGVLPTHDEKPVGNFFKGKAFLPNYIRDQFPITTWLLFGAVAQTLLFVIADRFAIGRIALVPAMLALLYKVADAYLMSIGWKHNIYMDGIVSKKVSTAFPDESGHYGNKPADQEVVVFLIGYRSNSPLGMFGEGVSDMNNYFLQMAKDLEEHGEEFGFLGMTSWLNSGDRTVASEILEVCYFRTVEGLQKFAHSEYHRKGWDWWNKNYKKHPHLSIFHETYHVPKGNWETVFINSHVSGINSTIHKYEDEMTGKPMWATPMVDASRGKLKASMGRMGRNDGSDHDKYGADPYQDQ